VIKDDPSVATEQVVSRLVIRNDPTRSSTAEQSSVRRRPEIGEEELATAGAEQADAGEGPGVGERR
jgi:hypothetical protein